MKLFTLSLLFLVSTVANADVKTKTTQKPQLQNLDFQKVLKQQGFVWLQDSGSNYVFESNGTFQSAPIGMSGRTLQGFWKQDDQTDPIIEVEAERGWVNGRSVIADFRKISFYVGSLGTLKKQNGALWLNGKRKMDSLYQTYWFVDSLERMSKPKGWDARKSRLPRSPSMLNP